MRNLSLRVPLSSLLEGFKDVDAHDLQRSISEFHEKFPRLKPESFTAKALREFFSRYVDAKYCAAIAQFVIYVNKIFRENDRDIDYVTKTISSYTSDLDPGIGGFKSAVDSLVKLSTSDEMEFIYKGSRLYYDINDKPDDLDLIVDVRPVFSKDARQQDGFIIRVALHIEKTKLFSYEKYEHSLSRAQIVELKEKCERALVKIDTAQRSLSAISPRGVAVFGEDFE